MNIATSIRTLCLVAFAGSVALWLATGCEGYTRWPNRRLELADAAPAAGEAALLAEAGFDGGAEPADPGSATSDGSAPAPVRVSGPIIESRFAFGLVPGGFDAAHLVSVATVGVLAGAVAGATLLRVRRTPVAAACTAMLLVAPCVHQAFADGRVGEPTPPANLPADAKVYCTLHHREAQVTFTSDAPLERIVGKSNEVTGCATQGPADNPAKLAAATWSLPVKSLATGLPLRDEHIGARDWLDSEAHPTISFALTAVEDIREVKRGEGFSTWSCTLVGTLTMHGVSRELKVADTRLTFMAASERTAAIAPGDLCFLKCDYSVKLSDFGVKNGDVPSKVSDTVAISQLLRMTTTPPAEAAPQKPANAAPPAPAP